MKTLYRISLFFLVASAFLCIGIMSKDMLDGKNRTKSREYIAEKAELLDDTSDITVVDNKTYGKITANTEYLVCEIQKKTNERIENKEPIPVKFIGLTRTELEEEIHQYNLAPTLTDQEKGFLTASLESFSEDRIIVDKVYDIPEIRNQEKYFFLVAENNLVIVLCEDHKTIYLKTDISMDILPEEVQSEILDTKYIENEAELYNFLESYSS